MTLRWLMPNGHRVTVETPREVQNEREAVAALVGFGIGLAIGLAVMGFLWLLVAVL